ncbi:MAG TPA: hypothetical protein VF765_18055 [Polyangiaceae bacterium]
MRARTLEGAAGLVMLTLASCSYLDPQNGPELVACTDVDSRPDAPVDFQRDIRPLIQRSNTDPTGHGCVACHDSTRPEHSCLDATGLDTSTLGGIRKGGHTTGTSIIVPGKPCESALVQKLVGDYPVGVQMPKDGPAYWSQSQIQLVKDWIAEGANGADSE